MNRAAIIPVQTEEGLVVKIGGADMPPRKRAASKNPVAGTKAADPARARGDYYLGLLLSLVWLLFLALPIHDLLNSDLSPLRLLVALAAVAAFVAAYLWLVLGSSFLGSSEDSERRNGSAAWCGFGVLTVLVLFLTVFYSSGWLWFLIFAATSTAMRFPTRQAVWTIAGLMVVTAGAGWTSGIGWQELMTVELIVGGTGLSMVGMSRMISTIRELHAAREEVARLAVSEERLRFARDLHDLLGHSLSLITLKSELAGRLLPVDPEKAASEVSDIEATAREALREVRDAVAGYRLPTLASELRGAREMLAAAGIGCRIEQEAETLPPQVDAILAWTVREGVTNVIRHSHARNCEIRITRNGHEARAEVVDDGQGNVVDIDEKVSGSGLRGVAERVSEGGGRFECGPRKADGFWLGVTLPVGDGVLADDTLMADSDGLRVGKR